MESCKIQYYALSKASFESYSETEDIAIDAKEGFNPVRCTKK